MKFTADMARERELSDLDHRIKSAAEEAINSGHRNAYMRVYADDWFKDNITELLKERGFSVQTDFTVTIKDDINFWWD